VKPRDPQKKPELGAEAYHISVGTLKRTENDPKPNPAPKINPNVNDLNVNDKMEFFQKDK
jgi:hypothetical protein